MRNGLQQACGSANGGVRGEELGFRVWGEYVEHIGFGIYGICRVPGIGLYGGI